jgi:hypothetical protein
MPLFTSRNGVLFLLLSMHNHSAGAHPLHEFVTIAKFMLHLDYSQPSLSVDFIIIVQLVLEPVQDL